MTQYEISAIIGHWRNGAILLEISLVTGYSNFEIHVFSKKGVTPPPARTFVPWC